MTIPHPFFIVAAKAALLLLALQLIRPAHAQTGSVDLNRESRLLRSDLGFSPTVVQLFVADEKKKKKPARLTGIVAYTKTESGIEVANVPLALVLPLDRYNVEIYTDGYTSIDDGDKSVDGLGDFVLNAKRAWASDDQNRTLIAGLGVLIPSGNAVGSTDTSFLLQLTYNYKVNEMLSVVTLGKASFADSDLGPGVSRFAATGALGMEIAVNPRSSLSLLLLRTSQRGGSHRTMAAMEYSQSITERLAFYISYRRGLTDGAQNDSFEAGLTKAL